MWRRFFVPAPRMPAVVMRMKVPTLSVFVFLLCVCTLFAAPRITDVSPRAIQLGSSEITIIGAGMNENTQLIFAVAGITSERVGEVKPDRLTFRVSCENVAPDFYSLRVVNESGVSNSVRVAIDSIPNVIATTVVKALPVAISNQLTGAAINTVAFEGQKGQAIVVDVEAKRLGSKLRPVVRLYDSRGTQIAWSPPQMKLQGDARCQATLPASGAYTIELHDRTYKGAAPGFYRLKISSKAVADHTLPAGLTRDKATSLKIFPEHATANATFQNYIESAPAGVWPLKLPQTFTGGAPGVVVSDFLEVTETIAKSSEPLPAPAAVTGVLGAKGERDVFRFAVNEGKKYRVEVFARSLGSPFDGVLAVKNQTGGQIAQNDDQPDRIDPMVDFTAPKGAAEVAVSLHDLYGKGGDDYLYRIVLSPLHAPWRVKADRASIIVPTGGRSIVKFTSTGATPTSDTTLKLWPSGDSLLNVAEAKFNRQQSATLMLLMAEKPFKPYVGHFGAYASDATRVVDVQGQTASPQPWLDNEIAIVPGPLKLSIDWRNASESPKLPAGGSVKFPVNLSRMKAVAGPIRLRLVTSQVVPTKVVKQNNQNVTVPDTAKAIQLAGTTVFENPPGETEIEIAVPPEVAAQPYELGLIAELLSADKKLVAATNASNIIRGQVTHPLRLKLTGEAKVQAVAGKGDTGSIKGSVIRGADYGGPVSVTLVGLAKEYPAPTVELAPDATDFELEVRFPAGAKPADLAGVRVQATLKNDGVSYLSNPIAVAVKVVAGKK